VDHEIKPHRTEKVGYCRAVTDVYGVVMVPPARVKKLGPDAAYISVWPEEALSHVIVYTMDDKPPLAVIPHGFRPDEPGRAGDKYML
jgi:hypothetical protein